MSGTVDNIQCPFGSDWEVIREIGHGSYGSVYLIERKIGNDIIQSAMKVIRLPDSEDEPEQIMRRTGRSREQIKAYYQSLGDALLPEIQLMSKLRGDSHIVSYEDHAVIDHDSGIGMDIFIRMEYLESLPHWLNGRQLTNGDVAQLGIQLCEGLETCAHNKIVHRDIKPANIFVAANGAFKLGDFGIAHKLGTLMEAEDRNLGSMNYIAPEVKRGDAFDERVDIYGLGMVMYRILNDGRIPLLPAAPATYTDEQEQRARDQRLNGAKLPKPAHCCDVLWSVIEKACTYHPDGRYQSAAEMGKALRAISGHSDLTQPLPVNNERHRDRDTSPRTRSTGPNGTELRTHSTGTPTPPPPPPVPPAPPTPQPIPPKPFWQNVRWIAVVSGVLVIVLVALIAHGKKNPEKQLEVDATGQAKGIGVTLREEQSGNLSVEIMDGQSPYTVSVVSGGFIIDSYQSKGRTVELDNLVPGSSYELQVADSKGSTGNVRLTSPGGEAYAGSDLQISSMIVYECDRQALANANGNWFTLSEKNRVHKLSEDGMVLRNAPAAGQSNRWHALVLAKASGETGDNLDVLLALRLANDVIVTQPAQLFLSSGVYAQTPVDLDPLLDKAWKACGQWITGEGCLEIYTQGQFLKEQTLKISTKITNDNGGY